MPEVADIEPAEFALLRPNPIYPQALIVQSSERHGVRFVLLGEDGEALLFLGHAGLDAMLRVATEECPYDDDRPAEAELELRWARYLTACPDHPGRRGPGGDCVWCETELGERNWWVDWSHPDGDPAAHRGEPGYFPVVVFDLERWR